MKFLKRFRSKANVGDEAPYPRTNAYVSTRSHQCSSYSGPDSTYKLSDKILQRVFAEVCPPSQDESYRSSEESFIDGGCALCDLRYLASCALVSRRWHNVAVAGAL